MIGERFRVGVWTVDSGVREAGPARTAKGIKYGAAAIFSSDHSDSLSPSDAERIKSVS